MGRQPERREDLLGFQEERQAAEPAVRHLVHLQRPGRVPAGQINGVQALAQYKPDPAGGHAPWALQVHEVADGRLSRLTFFLETERIFPAFGLPPHLG